MLGGVAQGGGRVRGSEHVAAHRLDVGFEPFDQLLRARMLLRCRGADRLRFIPRSFGIGDGLPAFVQFETGGLAPCLERADFGPDLVAARGEGPGLLPVELQLLLPARDRQLERVGAFAHA